MPFFRLTYVAEDKKRAQAEPKEALRWIRDLNGLRRTLTGGNEIYMDLDHWRQTRESDPPRYDNELRDTAYFGTPEQLTSWIQYLQQEHHVQYFVTSMSFGHLKHDQVMRSMALFAKEVMPQFP